jgi:hypothetical protein
MAHLAQLLCAGHESFRHANMPAFDSRSSFQATDKKPQE